MSKDKKKLLPLKWWIEKDNHKNKKLNKKGLTDYCSLHCSQGQNINMFTMSKKKGEENILIENQ